MAWEWVGIADWIVIFSLIRRCISPLIWCKRITDSSRYKGCTCVASSAFIWRATRSVTSCYKCSLHFGSWCDAGLLITVTCHSNCSANLVTGLPSIPLSPAIIDCKENSRLILINNRIGREGLGPRGIWDWVQGVSLVQGVTRFGLVCNTPYGMASGGHKEPFPEWLWLWGESSPHRRALHISVLVLAGNFKI